MSFSVVPEVDTSRAATARACHVFPSPHLWTQKHVFSSFCSSEIKLNKNRLLRENHPLAVSVLFFPCPSMHRCVSAESTKPHVRSTCGGLFRCGPNARAPIGVFVVVCFSFFRKGLGSFRLRWVNDGPTEGSLEAHRSTGPSQDVRFPEKRTGAP